MKKILLVEDEIKIAKLVQEYLNNEGFAVSLAYDGEEGWSLFSKLHPDLVLLDVMLPRLSGLELCRRIRKDSNTPIIMVTARSEEIDKLIGLELGADDYITKPFSLRELVARVKAVLRRGSPSDDQQIFTFENLKLDPIQHTLTVSDTPIALTPTEFRIIELLMRSPQRVFTRVQLLEYAIGEAFEGYERSIDTHVRNLRRKLEKQDAQDYIVTVFGVGYKLGVQKQ